ncbi:P-loop containing nucleoside triphosphate hydrolase protein [Hysterangium stoloniferum]|nr:P-loop containing nucleoside triphosphate hydrolase protein [Hysterangium stoloniferum]
MIPIIRRLKRRILSKDAPSADTFQSGPQEQTSGQHFGIKVLSSGISPTIEILTYGYDAYTQSTATSSTQTLDSHAESFLARLSAFRKSSDTTKRPIIFIAHSVGGIVLKHALIQASQAHEGHLVEHKWIAVSTYAILFLSTPHQGTNAIAKLANQHLQLGSLSSKTNKILLKHLISNSEWLQQQSASYNAISANFRTKLFHETLPTVLPDKRSQIIVPKLSAVIPGAIDMEVVGMSKDHYGMTKFASQSDDDFILMLSVIKNMTESASSVVQHQWSKFEQTEMASTAVTYIAKLCPSPRFLGQQEHIITLKKFFAPDNSQTWRHFLLYGMAGVGKTQICLKFIEDVLENEYGYWRIIWIDATNTVSLEDSFISIADDPEAKAIGVKRSSSAVLTWLAHHRRKWLLVFDNADGVDGEVLNYLKHLRPIHVLITSRNHGLHAHVTSYMEILPMDEDRAVSLFHIAALLSNCSDAAVIELSRHIVRTLGFLPLAVDIAGATISTGLCTTYDYLKMYQTQRVHLLDGEDPSLKGATGYNHTVYSALNISYNLIERAATCSKKAQDALLVLKVLGFFHHQNIMETIFKQAAESDPAVTYDENLPTTSHDLPSHLLQCKEDGQWTNIAFRQAMQVLCDYSLLSKDGPAEFLSWTMHPVIHTWSRDKALLSDSSGCLRIARAIIVGCIPLGDALEDIMA